MDAKELMEWVAYYKLQDEKGLKEIQTQMTNEQTIAESAAQLRALLNTMTLRPTHGPDK